MACPVTLGPMKPAYRTSTGSAEHRASTTDGGKRRSEATPTSTGDCPPAPGPGTRHRRSIVTLSLVLLPLALLVTTSPAVSDQSALRWQSPEAIAEGDAWQGPWRMNASDFRYVDDPTVAMNSAGRLAIAWVDQARQDVLLEARAADGSPLAPEPVNVSRSPDVFSWLPRVILGEGDAVYVLWQEIVFSGGSHGGEIFFARSLDGGRSFDAPRNLSNTVAGAGKGRLDRDRWHNGSLDLARAADGTLYAAWTEYEGALRVSRSDNSGERFTAPITLVEANGETLPARAPSLAVTDDGIVHLAWSVGEDPAANIHIASSADGGRTFGPARVVHASPGHADTPFLLAVDDTLVLAYGYSDPRRAEPSRLAVTHSEDQGASFRRPEFVAHGPELEDVGLGFPSMALSEAGIVLIAERIPPPTGPRRGLAAARLSMSGEASPAEPIPGSSGPPLGPNGGRQGPLMHKVATDGATRVALVHSTFERNQRSAIWLFEGRAETD